MSGNGFISRYYDVVLNGTAGCHSFPTRDPVEADLREAGLGRIETSRLLSGPGVLVLRARAATGS